MGASGCLYCLRCLSFERSAIGQAKTRLGRVSHLSSQDQHQLRPAQAFPSHLTSTSPPPHLIHFPHCHQRSIRTLYTTNGPGLMQVTLTASVAHLIWPLLCSFPERQLVLKLCFKSRPSGRDSYDSHRCSEAECFGALPIKTVEGEVILKPISIFDDRVGSHSV